MLGFAALSLALAQDAPYAVRGRLTEAAQMRVAAQLDRVHVALAAAARQDAPALLATLDPPPPPPAAGYQRLPRIVDDAPPATAAAPQLTSYSWRWSETLLARQSAALSGLEQALASLSGRPAAERAAALAPLIGEFRRVAAARRSIDADVAYNWFWQREVMRDRPRYDLVTRLIDEAERASSAGASLPAGILDASAPQRVPAFVRHTVVAPRQHLFSVALTSDLADQSVVERVRAAVDAHWRVDLDGETFRVALDVRSITPAALYCGDAASRGAQCVPPAEGAPIDVAAHVGRFPLDRAVLTTGGATLHVAGGRAVVLAPFDVTPRVLAHEIGHLLGFPDAYVRGYRDDGADGFRILEYVPDLTDLMAAPGRGGVKARHFRQLVAAIR